MIPNRQYFRFYVEVDRMQQLSKRNRSGANVLRGSRKPGHILLGAKYQQRVQESSSGTDLPPGVDDVDVATREERMGDFPRGRENPDNVGFER